MPLQKPRGRKQQSHKKAYASVAVLVILGLAVVTYAYANGDLKLGGGGEQTTTSSTQSTSLGTPCGILPASNSSNTYACIDTTQGAFEVSLYSNCAPQTVANFVKLAKEGFYSSLVWHRIVPGFVIQTGDPNSKNGLNSTRPSWGNGGSSQTVPLEVSACPSLGNNVGYLAMARQGTFTTGLDTGTSQFFVNLANNSDLNTHYTVFGKVLGNGMNVVNAIAGVQTYCESGQSTPAGCAPGGYPEQPVRPSQAMVVSITVTS